MPFPFSATDTALYRSGSLFLGYDDQAREIGIQTERHAITVAGAGAGKGAALIIPNLLRWPHSALVIDPKGENAEKTWQAREAMGQAVYVLDPFKVADVPDRLRARFNPFDRLDPASLAFREDVRVIADGLVLRPNPKDAEWYNGAVDVLAGFMAYNLTEAPAGSRSLPDVRALLRLPEVAEKAVLQGMAESVGNGGLAAAAGSLLLGGTKSGAEYLKMARTSTSWLDSAPLAAMLQDSTFDLAALKSGKATVYLVLPPHLIAEHARFLRLFVRCALDAMAKGGNRQGGRCLFLLDEFFSLGRIDEIGKAAGLMRSYGVHLWPFLQDLGQLQELYGGTGAETFFGNADAHIYFGNTDALTLKYVSAQLETIRPDEIATAPPAAPIPHLNTKPGDFLDWRNAVNREKHETAMNDYRHKMGMAGKARLTPLEVRELVAKPDGHAVARSMIVFGKGSDIFNLKLAPYFAPAPSRSSILSDPLAQSIAAMSWPTLLKIGMGVAAFGWLIS